MCAALEVFPFAVFEHLDAYLLITIFFLYLIQKGKCPNIKDDDHKSVDCLVGFFCPLKIVKEGLWVGT